MKRLMSWKKVHQIGQSHLLYDIFLMDLSAVGVKHVSHLDTGKGLRIKQVSHLDTGIALRIKQVSHLDTGIALQIKQVSHLDTEKRSS